MEKGHYAGCELVGDALSCRCESRRYVRILVLTLFIFAFEVVGGLVSGSLALLSDAGHVLVDATALLVCMYVARCVRLGRGNESHVRAMGGYANAALLWAIVAGIVVESMRRLLDPAPVAGMIMLAVASAGIVLNALQLFILHRVQHKDRHVTFLGMDKHLFTDLLQSVAVIAGALGVMATGWQPIDPLVSLFIAWCIGRAAVHLWRECRHTDLGLDHSHSHHH